jgi:hypothetical protein
MARLGCYEYDGIYGKYYDHNGWLHNGGTPNRGLNTGVIHLADGYDALLLFNAQFVDQISPGRYRSAEALCKTPAFLCCH